LRLQVDRTLADKGDLTAPTDFTFNFSSFDRTFESYYGNNIKLRYFIRVTIDRAGLSSNIVSRTRLTPLAVAAASRCLTTAQVHEQDFMVQRVEALPEQNPPIKMEVGIEDCLHICFNYDRSRLYERPPLTSTPHFCIKLNMFEPVTSTRPSLAPSSSSLCA
jgi:vacuolar protein sorting-associated protein 26